jgi:hypothetical protein
MSQPLNLASATAEDDTYPGDEELSRMDLSVIDNLTEHSSDGPSFTPPPVSKKPRTQAIDASHGTFQQNQTPTFTPPPVLPKPQTCARHAIDTSHGARQQNDTSICCPRYLRKILPLQLSNPSCYAVKGRELMLYKDL